MYPMNTRPMINAFFQYEQNEGALVRSQNLRSKISSNVSNENAHAHLL